MLGLGQWSYAALQVWLAGWMQPEVLRQQAAQRLKPLFTVARMNAPLYAKLYRKLPSGMPPLHVLPVVTKHALMADVTASLTDRGPARRCAADRRPAWADGRPITAGTDHCDGRRRAGARLPADTNRRAQPACRAEQLPHAWARAR